MGGGGGGGGGGGVGGGGGAVQGSRHTSLAHYMEEAERSATAWPSAPGKDSHCAPLQNSSQTHWDKEIDEEIRIGCCAGSVHLISRTFI